LTLLQGRIILEFSTEGNGQQFKKGEVYIKVQLFAGNQKSDYGYTPAFITRFRKINVRLKWIKWKRE